MIHQSREAHSCKTAINADGVGVAWYGTRAQPGLYKDVRPAWSDPNLLQLVHQTIAPVFLAHVRASTGSATSYANCHPFADGCWSFMHNGVVGDFDQLRKRIEGDIADHLYAKRKGSTDSEAIFLLALSLGLESDPMEAMTRALARIETHARNAGIKPHIRFASCWSDGQALYAYRYATDRFAPSLYYNRTEQGTFVVSEPLDHLSEHWTEVPPGSGLRVCGSDFGLSEVKAA